MTREEILKHLQKIEVQYNVKILYAVESGSRAWGFSSLDSDWDVRFIYVHPLNWYLTVNLSRDVIEIMTDEGFDAVGWDIRKALQLYRKTNPTMLEWLRSPIVYIDNMQLKSVLLSSEIHFFNTKRGIYHYFHVATNHQNRYLEKRGVELKRFLYYFRSLLACKWIIKNGTPPPVPFEELVATMVDDKQILDSITGLLTLKRKSKEHDKEIVTESLLIYGAKLQKEVESELSQFVEHKPTLEKDPVLDALLYNMVTKSETANYSNLR